MLSALGWRVGVEDDATGPKESVIHVHEER